MISRVLAPLVGAFCVCYALTVQPASAQPTNTQLRPGGCPPAIFRWWQQQGGRISCAADATKPAILLFHGLHQDAHTWTAPSHVGYAYDLRHPGVDRIGKTHAAPNAGIYKISTSPFLYGGDRRAWDKNVNWFDYLASRGFTVATWSQPGLVFSTAYRSAVEAFDSLLSHTRQLSPGALPPVALIGHSRGGLLIRKVLKERGSADRVEWVFTLHSPHRGSALGQTPGQVTAETVDLLDCCIPAQITGGFKEELKKIVVEAMRPLTKLVWPDENRELTPDGPLMRSLAENERPIPGVQYYTFGGTNPTYYRTYVWIFDEMSAVPQYRNVTQYFVWRARPNEIPKLSPVMDGLRDFVDEVVPGKGDGLVTDASARLPWSKHTTTNLNHAEVLWHRPLQIRIANIIAGGRSRTLASPLGN